MAGNHIHNAPLGQKSEYISTYSPELLCPIPRENRWKDRGYEKAPYQGVDVWNAYEISWLNNKGVPQLAIGEFIIPCTSPNLIESKSFKLYLNSFAQTQFESLDKVLALMKTDLSTCAGMDVEVQVTFLKDLKSSISEFEGSCLDELDISTSIYEPNKELLRNDSDELTKERLFSHNLRSLCPVTGQPDWGSVYIEYSGPAIEHAGLLKYLISYREHSDFHEQCVENIYLDIMECCQPEELTVYARYLRRGGLDINPFRTNTNKTASNIRLVRQ